MDIKTQISSISELRVAEEFVRNGFSVFQQINGKEPFDLVVCIKDILYKVSVKSVLRINKNNSYSVQLRRIRSNKTKNNIYLFDNKSCDILAVYLHDINKVVFISTRSITKYAMISIRKEKTNRAKGSFIIEEHTLNKFIENWQSG